MEKHVVASMITNIYSSAWTSEKSHGYHHCYVNHQLYVDISKFPSKHKSESIII